MNILLFGIQGSGKSTVGKYLANKLGIPFISSGDIFRQLREQDSENGRVVKALIDAGKFVDDALTMKIVNERLTEDDTKEGFVLDGAPRNLAQEKLFSKQPDLIVLVELEEKRAIERLLARGRHDDTPEAIKKRLDWTKQNTQPLIDFYKAKGVRVVEVDNSPPTPEVEKALDGLFEN